MIKDEIGILLCSFPLVLFLIFVYFRAWHEAFEDYKEFNINAGIIVMSVLTFFIFSISFGLYLILSK